MGKFYARLCEELIVYARQLAWFQSAPVVEQSKALSSQKEKEKPPTRAQSIESRGGVPLMPDLGDVAYVVNYWHDLGIVECGGMGPVPLSAREIMAWQEGTGTELQFWEFNALRQMSRAYLSQAHDSEKMECPPPYGAPEQTIDRKLVGKQIGNLFKSMI